MYIKKKRKQTRKANTFLVPNSSLVYVLFFLSIEVNRITIQVQKPKVTFFFIHFFYQNQFVFQTRHK